MTCTFVGRKGVALRGVEVKTSRAGGGRRGRGEDWSWFLRLSKLLAKQAYSRARQFLRERPAPRKEVSSGKRKISQSTGKEGCPLRGE